MTRAELEALIDAGDADACIAAFRGMPEAERLTLGAAAVARLRAVGKGVSARLAPFLEFDSPSRNAAVDAQLLRSLSFDVPRLARYHAARAAVLATASFSQWKGVMGHGLPGNDVASRILSDRRPEWLAELLEQICDEEDRLNQRWPLVRRLVREGYSNPPRSPRYIDRMLSSLQGEGSHTGGGLAKVLLDDPGLLEHEIWRIFETEPGPLAVSLLARAGQHCPPELTWEGALAKLAAEGRIGRDRLLDATLDGLSRDMHEMRARWFAALHDKLEPTHEEKAARSARYVELLGSRNASTIAFAIKVLKGVVKRGEADRGAIVDRLAPAFHSRTKGTVKQALRSARARR